MLKEVKGENRQLKLENTELKKTIGAHDDTMQTQGVRIADLERERHAARSLCAAGEAIDLWFSYRCLQARLDEDEKWYAVSRAAKAVAQGRKQASWANKHGSEQEQQAAQQQLLVAQALLQAWNAS